MIRLRPYKACDADRIVTWIKDEVMFHQWSANRFNGLYPLSAAALNSYYDREAYNDSFWQMTAIDEYNQVVGHFIMRFTDEEKKTVRLGFVILDDSKRGRGYGKEMIGLAVRYALEILRAEKVTLGVFTNNPSAHACYAAAGFQDVYTNERAFRIGHDYWPCTEMEINAKKER